MPLVKINVRKSWEPSKRKALIEAVHAAIVGAIKIPKTDRQILFRENRPEDFEAPPGKSDQYTLVELTLFPGRSPDAKKNLFRAITQNLRALGIPSDDVLVILNETPKENWGFGGVPASEMKWEYKIDV